MNKIANQLRQKHRRSLNLTGLSEALVRHAYEEIERLEDIVDKLPKCWRLDEQGGLVQDVPVVPGMTVWTTGYDGVRQVEVMAIQEHNFITVAFHGDWEGSGSEHMHNTREAAEKDN